MLVFVCLLAGIAWTYSTPVCWDFNDGCICTRPETGRLDLGQIALTNGSARFQNVKGADGIYYSYNPCYPFTQIDPSTQQAVEKCNKVAICARNSSHYNATATEKGAKFEFDNEREELFVHYQNPEIPSLWTRVYVRCGQRDELRVVSRSEMYLSTSVVCTGGLSPGSILLLVFFSGVLSYLLIGCLIKKAIGEATGRQLVPNYSFWSELPALVKDGYMFFLSPCLGDRVSYSNAYQNI